MEYAKLAEIDGVFRKLIDNLLNTHDWFAAFFLLRAHSAFLAGSHLAMSGQAAEAYASLRLCLENGLYGLYLARNPGSRALHRLRRPSERASPGTGPQDREGRARGEPQDRLSHDDPLVSRVCLTTAAQVGALVLGMFRIVFRERLDLTGLSDDLTRARQGL